jgi:DNA-binding beta-propeller fold protein YncE
MTSSCGGVVTGLFVLVFAGLFVLVFGLPGIATAAVSGKLTQFSGNRGCIQHQAPATSEGCAPGRGLFGAHGVTLSPDGRNAYVTGNLGLAIFARDRATGALRQLPGEDGCVQGEQQSDVADATCKRGHGKLFGQGGAAVSPDGRSVYNVHFGGLSVFARNRATGSIEQLPGRAGCLRPRRRTKKPRGSATCAQARVLAAAGDVEVSPDGRNVYVAAYNASGVAVFTRDRRTGVLTQLRGARGCVSASQFTRITRRCTRARGLRGAQQLDMSRDGRNLYVAAAVGVSIFRREPRTGALTQLSRRAGCVSLTVRGCARGRALGNFDVSSVSVSPDGKSTYIGSLSCVPPNDECFGALMAMRRSRATGALHPLRGRAGCIDERRRRRACLWARGLGWPQSIVVTRDGRNAYVAGGMDIVMLRRNRRTGALARLTRRRSVVRGRGVDDPRSLAVSSKGRHVYVASTQADAVAIFARRR